MEGEIEIENIKYSLFKEKNTNFMNNSIKYKILISCIYKKNVYYL